MASASASSDSPKLPVPQLHVIQCRGSRRTTVRAEGTRLPGCQTAVTSALGNGPSGSRSPSFLLTPQAGRLCCKPAPSSQVSMSPHPECHRTWSPLPTMLSLSCVLSLLGGISPTGLPLFALQVPGDHTEVDLHLRLPRCLSLGVGNLVRLPWPPELRATDWGAGDRAATTGLRGSKGWFVEKNGTPGRLRG